MASIHSLFAPAVGAHTTIVAGRPLYSLSICHRTHNEPTVCAVVRVRSCVCGTWNAFRREGVSSRSTRATLPSGTSPFHTHPSLAGLLFVFFLLLLLLVFFLFFALVRTNRSLKRKQWNSFVRVSTTDSGPSMMNTRDGDASDACAFACAVRACAVRACAVRV